MGPYIDIIILAIIAIALVIKLVSILGQRNDNAPIVKFDDVDKPSVTIVDENLSPQRRLKFLDPSFNQEDFIEGAKSAFVMILENYAKGDTRILSNLVDIDILKQMALAISEREENEQICHINEIRILSAEIENIKLNNNDAAEISVEFKAEAIAYILDKRQKLVAGHDQKIENISDSWVFRKSFQHADSEWKLAIFTNFPLL